MKDKKTEITTETFEVMIIRRHGRFTCKWCEGCGKQVALISLDEACMSGLSIEAVEGQVGAGRIHFLEKAGGSSLICLNSLIQSERRQP